MAALTHSVLSGVSVPFTRLRAGVRRVAESLAERRLHTRHMHDLARFSDRELWDVGLSRSDFMAIEKGIFRRG